LPMKKLLLIVLSVVLITGLIITGCSQAPSTTPTTAQKIKVGGCMPLSGPPSAGGIGWSQGWKLAFDKINEEGGLKVGGTTYMIDLIVQDDKATQEGGTTAANLLCYQENCKFILGSIVDFQVPVIYKVSSAAGALYGSTLVDSSAALANAYADVGPDKPLLVRLWNTPDESALQIGEYLHANYPNVKNVAYLGLVMAEFDLLAQDCINKWAQFGLKSTGDYERFAPDAFDFVPSVTKMLASDPKPDAIVFWCGPSHFALISKTARDMGFTGPLIMPFCGDPGWTLELVPNASDVYATGIALNAANNPGEVKKVIELGRAKFGDKGFIEDSVWGYDVAMILAQMIEKAGSTDPQKVQSTFEGLTSNGSLKSIFGDCHVGGLKTAGVNRVLVRPVPWSRVNNGKPEFIKMFSIDVP
jgi:branched-chain amino acid transport system substrate-binding protein